MASTDTNTPKLKSNMTRPASPTSAIRVFQGARNNQTTPSKATSPAITTRGVRHSPVRSTDGGTPNRGAATVTKGIRSAPRDARSL